MGLDMYLMKVKKQDILEPRTMISLARELYTKDERNAVLFEPFEKLGLTYTYTRWEHRGEETCLEKEVAYWRKCNQIHNWIYTNCAEHWQEDSDDIFVSKEQVEKLIDVCHKVLEDLKTCEKEIVQVKAWSGGQEVLLPKEVYKSELAKELLPTQSGFFFGSTEYDEWYRQDLVCTIEQLEKVLEETDFESEQLYYYASY